jgi:hydroxymethylpyrimidine/phosphomethylpyrimidine kinase
VHGTCAITAVTAQNTLAVSAVYQLPAEIVLAQVRAVVSDIGVDAVKVGMLGSAEIALAVAQAIDELPAGTPVVVDPVMVAESGARLLAADAHEALVREILPRASVLTPNLPEARVLAGLDPAEAVGGTQQSGQLPSVDEDADDDAQVQALARAVLALGPRAVVLTGGHRSRAVDVFIDSEHAAGVQIEGERHPDGAAHGSGCTHSSLLAAQLALGHTPLEAARTARALAAVAVAHGLRDVGAGAGPVDVLDIASMRAH